MDYTIGPREEVCAHGPEVSCVYCSEHSAEPFVAPTQPSTREIAAQLVNVSGLTFGSIDEYLDACRKVAEFLGGK